MTMPWRWKRRTSNAVLDERAEGGMQGLLGVEQMCGPGGNRLVYACLVRQLDRYCRDNGG